MVHSPRRLIAALALVATLTLILLRVTYAQTDEPAEAPATEAPPVPTEAPTEAPADAAIPTAEPTEAPAERPVFSLPFAGEPGPSTWLYEQHFGNTVSAYNFGVDWYASGQGLHFGIDLEAKCGTPVLAIGDGVVRYVDAEGFGSGPHNLIIDHTGTGYSSLYGHLNRLPVVSPGDTVTRGQVVAESGDPDLTCGSRPHLHLEIRTADFTYAYNPTEFIDANWHMLASIGLVYSTFEQDLEHPTFAMRIEDQPDVKFGANWLNHFQRAWPVKLERQPPANPPLARHLDPLPESVTVTRTAVSLEAWNLGSWWDPADPDAVYLVDDVPGQDETGVFRQPLDGSARAYTGTVPPPVLSPDGSVTIVYQVNGSMQVTRRADGSQWEVLTQGSYPAVSPDGTRLLWRVYYADILPGTQPPGMEVWVSNLDGTVQRRVYRQSGGWVTWLDAHRLLIAKRVAYQADEQLFILDVDDPALTPQLLGSYTFLRRVEVAPGGGRIAFYEAFQDDPNASGIYVQETQPGSQPVKLDAFGAYHWRDDRSLYMLSYDPSQSVHTLGLYDVAAGSFRALTGPAITPIRVANSEWSVSPDGARIVYVDPEDYGLYMLTIGAGGASDPGAEAATPEAVG